jgi:ankyrin repeat protein
LIDVLSGKYIEHKNLSNDELTPDLSGEDQVFPPPVWQDKLKYDNYFKPKILHKDNNYLFVKALSRFWAIGEEGLYDHLRRSNKLSEAAISANLPIKDKSTPLMRALKNGQIDDATTLLNTQGLNLDAVDERGRTALYHAVVHGDQKIVMALLERKARTDTVTKDGKTLLHAAFEPKPGRLSSEQANIELVKLLAARKDIDINKEDGEGMTPMVLAIDHDQPEIVKLFLARSDLDVNKRPATGDYLNRAIRHSKLRYGYEIAMMLLDRKEIDVNVPYYKGETVVHLSWYSPGAGPRGLEMVNKVFARHPDLNRENEYGETPLVYNINQKRPEAVRLLVGTKGVDINRLITSENRTPLGLEKAGAREFNFVGNENKTPEGIPQTLLQNETASQAIIFYRGYLLETTGRTLQHIQEKKTDDAIQLQEFILDEIIAEMGDSIPKYSAEQRKRAVSTFTLIRDHYSRYPRSRSTWFAALPEDKKTMYAKLDVMRDEVIGGKYDNTPDGELKNHPPMVPILILRDYMAKNTIKALGQMKSGKTAEAEAFLKDVMKRSDPAEAQQK